VERETGIEPATSSLGSWRSTTELLPPLEPIPRASLTPAVQAAICVLIKLIADAPVRRH
jgi:hypothetical protein